ncbi:MAG: VWA domain-containing protein, partial [Verrucomicrobiota bacterium]
GDAVESTIRRTWIATDFCATESKAEVTVIDADSLAVPADVTTTVAGSMAVDHLASGGFSRRIQSGRLTAGSFNDAADPEHFEAFARKRTDRQSPADLENRFLARPIEIRVKDESGQPMGNVRVRVGIPGPLKAVEAVTRTDGRVIFMPGWDGLEQDKALEVEFFAKGHSSIRRELPAGSTRHEVELPAPSEGAPTRLDLGFVVDCTGSMSDELEYLKVEVRDIAARIKSRFPEVEQRYGLVVYRDVGDEYVTRNFDFTPDLKEFHAFLGQQQATGGGNYEEAVDQALAAAATLEWRQDNATRVLFHIADAPPHAPQTRSALSSVNRLRASGVAIYPVASSGVRDEAEFVMRVEALLTGSHYLFLTDDSGVGNAHAEPHFPYYDVEPLDRLMVRMIASELTATPVLADPGDIVRSVGRDR